ncbi:hypothetical protein CcaverHIS002_0400880 [Cutaneotrichosporon cavernicola]|uniref:Nitroreductase domain-containing protein n=1 Tax=Cutaneotrichosporon cavernicola TaxID=279322 RepID=A0AA48L3G1_9TREE|nr:uncharacterized protein CcaverHIS019_0400840 [Cutaneotrichosporon cavernicola]BEI83484.1 hypothetical protein CcaverHIS002_0400880 [Cutaneotrichosporon cavernicola]BEI91264.1 hypothetical protein CcaverHIS019_0400840 [Cutaneotrichosporon cavernicola]BEI99037.1 hypothetical protein CcaverHIS631_0400800 [Cutaneotrichosporon cavernicola]BEJ06811.1 hypothetical protein CcaverHIS641_0400800 [Cutaneotrichosporon cavernicola]
MTNSVSSAQLFAALRARRSVYAIKPSSPISDSAIRELVEAAIHLAPTAYNSQTPRIALVFGDKHKRVWDAMWIENQKTFPDAEFEAAQRKKWENGFMSGYGSIVFFDDRKTLEEFIAKMPHRKVELTAWSKNGTGILQHTVWTALAAEGLGASLQHFPQISTTADAALRKVIDVPEEWECTAIMPFGEIVQHPAEKPKLPVSELVKVFD